MRALIMRSRGDAEIGLVQPPGQPDRMSAVLTFTAAGGQAYQVELTRADVVRVAEGLGVAFNAEPDRVASWWYRLRHGDRAGALPTAEACDV